MARVPDKRVRRDGTAGGGGWLPQLWRNLPLEHETVVFVAVSTCDLVCTVVLLQSGRFRETNTLAQWVLRHWGLVGLIRFKLAFVAAVCVLAQVVARRRPEAGRRLLNAGSVLVGLVLVLSLVEVLRWLRMGQG